MAVIGKPNILIREKGDRGEASPIRGVCSDGNMVFKVFFNTDNYASPELHGITLSLHEAEMKGELIVLVTHVTDPHMKELGIDFFSRGEFLWEYNISWFPIESNRPEKQYYFHSI